MKKNGLILTGILIIAVVITFLRISKRIAEKSEQAKHTTGREDSIPVYSPPVDSFPYLYKTYEEKIQNDSSRIILLTGSSAQSLGTPLNTVMVDGDMVFDLQHRSLPLTVKTRILQLTAFDKPIFRVVAYSHENGEKVEVLQGTVIAKKRYKSDYPEPDTLHASQMLMINDQIDLMEKEKADLSDFSKWWKERK